MDSAEPPEPTDDRLGAPPPTIGELTSDGKYWWAGEKKGYYPTQRLTDDHEYRWVDRPLGRSKWKASQWQIPKSYLFVIIPLIVLVLGVVAWELIAGDRVSEAVIGLASTALGALVGLLIPHPGDAGDRPPPASRETGG